MAKLGFGYGSEWQLLRIMGRHRNYFDKLVLEELSKKSIVFEKIDWFDFKFNGSLDNELLGQDLIPKTELGDSSNILKRTNWDCVGKVSDTLILGEAKGHIDEFSNIDKSSASTDSKEEYKIIVTEVLNTYNIDLKYIDSWFNEAYQLGNRISMNFYLNKLGLKNKLLYIFFINDWLFDYTNKKGSLNNSTVKNKDTWIIAFDNKLEKLGFVTTELKNKIKEQFLFVYPNCNQK